ncbi:serine hydrolase domain-containing protein [Singulisphaera sp. PoT]|uniref:serine hydrolase domain-containing protein n=1 Tax=Singulisphaera sp. PoT TaxID=3411797 RepID=UPI003BF5BCFF
MTPVPIALRLAPVLLAAFVVLNLAAAHAAEPRVAEALQPFVDRHALAGAVALVAAPDKVLSVEVVGFSDVAKKTPMKADALFWIASMSKPMTSTGLMMLVDEGKVHLDDPVAKYLPEFHGQMLVAEKTEDRLVLKKPGHPITVREILSHTSGLVARSPLERELDSIPLRDASISYGLSPLHFEPGSKYEYCNPGINTAGRIIEVVGGKPYEEFMQERLFGPLAMKDTTFWPNEEQLSRLAKSYKPNAEHNGLDEVPITQLSYPLTNRKRHPYPAGGLFSTAADVATFCRMIANGGTLDGHRYVSESAVRQMTSTQTGSLINHGHGEGGYGLGWSTSRKSKGDSGPVIVGTCGHGGAYATSMSIEPDSHIVTVLMLQHAGFPPGVDGGKIHEAFVKAAKEDLKK